MSQREVINSFVDTLYSKVLEKAFSKAPFTIAQLTPDSELTERLSEEKASFFRVKDVVDLIKADVVIGAAVGAAPHLFGVELKWLITYLSFNKDIRVIAMLVSRCFDVDQLMTFLTQNNSSDKYPIVLTEPRGEFLFLYVWIPKRKSSR